MAGGQRLVDADADTARVARVLLAHLRQRRLEAGLTALDVLVTVEADRLRGVELVVPHVHRVDRPGLRVHDHAHGDAVLHIDLHGSCSQFTSTLWGTQRAPVSRLTTSTGCSSWMLSSM